MKRKTIEVNRKVKRTLNYAKDFLAALYHICLAVWLLSIIPVFVNMSLVKALVWWVFGLIIVVLIWDLWNMYKNSRERANKSSRTRLKTMSKRREIKKPFFYDWFRKLMEAKEKKRKMKRPDYENMKRKETEINTKIKFWKRVRIWSFLSTILFILLIVIDVEISHKIGTQPLCRQFNQWIGAPTFTSPVSGNPISMLSLLPVLLGVPLLPAHTIVKCYNLKSY
jgi:hypothetical protein